MYIFELLNPVGEIKGIGPAARAGLAALAVRTVADLLLHRPRSYEDRSKVRGLATARSPLGDGFVCTEATVIAHDYFGYGPKKTLKIVIEDTDDQAELVCFGRNFLANGFPIGTRIRVAGSFAVRFGELQSSAFDCEPADRPTKLFERILAIYPLAGSLTQHHVRRAVEQALSAYLIGLQDELPVDVRAERGLMGKEAAIRALHTPTDMASVRAAVQRLAFDELLIHQISIVRRTIERRSCRRPAAALPTRLRDGAIGSLPFTLTDAQQRCLLEICADLGATFPMARLLQGDVGSGKTMVAFLAALPVIEQGRQVAFVAPTELLARQHADNAARLLEPTGVRIAFLTGSVGDRARKPLLAALSAGEVDLVIGTHAVFAANVEFRRLGLVIIDEQHRFGVEQRSKLVAKGEYPDVLAMTATPIPRTLALTAYGSMDVSTLDEMPPGRVPVETHAARLDRVDKVYEWVRRQIAAGRQAYFIYPAIDSNDTGTSRTGKAALKSAERMFEELQATFPDVQIGLIHSRLADEVKRRTMAQFAAGEFSILVATSVVEVGVDVANATCMVIEHAERFGLAALHQLRGRVGRGADQAYTFLVYDPDLTEEAKQRIQVMMSTVDGFKIAEADLAIRGPGEMTGVQQSGFPRLKFAEIGPDLQPLLDAKNAATAIIERDAGLLRAEHAGLARAMADWERSMLGAANE